MKHTLGHELAMTGRYLNATPFGVKNAFKEAGGETTTCATEGCLKASDAEKLAGQVQGCVAIVRFTVADQEGDFDGCYRGHRDN